ncbi:hypothetical protein [Bacillus mycoides]|uniref:hypothetical protein n=1 Tax=Bacillus mycoides TaxID=1405 RepID=UPI0011A05B2F|nr:hypothetical protein [Bacillus mycoides]
MYVKKVLFLIGLALLLMGCSNNAFDQAVEKGKGYIESREYDKAIATFELALQEQDDENIKTLLKQTKNMSKAIQTKEEQKYDETLVLLQNVKDEKNGMESVKKEATKLEEEIKGEQKVIKEVNEALKRGEELIEKSEYGDAAHALEEVITLSENKPIVNSQREQANKLLIPVKEKLATFQAAEDERKRQKELQLKNMYVNEEYRFSIKFPTSWVSKHRVKETNLGGFKKVFAVQYQLSDKKYYDVFYVGIVLDGQGNIESLEPEWTFIGNSREKNHYYRMIGEMLPELEDKPKLKDEFTNVVRQHITSFSNWIEVYPHPTQGTEDPMKNVLQD